MELQLKIPSIDLFDEWEDLRLEAISWFNYIYIFCGILVATYIFNGDILERAGSPYTPLIPEIAMIGIAMLSQRFKNHHLQFAKTLLIVNLWVVMLITQLFIVYIPTINFLTLFPVIIGIAITQKRMIPKLAIVAIALVIFVDCTAYGVVTIMPTTLLIMSFVLTVSGVGYLILSNAQQIVEWAVDSQNKNYIRAESFYAQGEKLLHMTHELNQAKEQVEKVSQAKSSFLSNMSHELRTPLNMVIGYTSSILNMPQMYDNQELPQIFQHDIELILSSGQYLLTLINDILDLSKIESGKFEISPVAFDLIPILQGVMATTLGLVKDKPLQLKPGYPDELPLLYGDPMRIRQILLNLMSNAVKYTHTGSVVLSVEVCGEVVRISVIDTGVGISQDAIATIFDRFEQVQNNSNIQGTGLGLDISQHLAHMHNTEIRVQSTIGVGSTFAFDLALATSEQMSTFDDDDTIHNLSGIKRFDTPEPEWAATTTVLIAEDDSVFRGLLIRAFEAHKHVVFDVQDGDDVYDTASALLPHLIVLDLILPHKNGWDILQELKNDPETRDIPVIVLTGHNELQGAVQDMADVILIKPVSAESIIEVSQELIVATTI